jgi:hypothetical protein
MIVLEKGYTSSSRGGENEEAEEGRRERRKRGEQRI